MPVRSNTLKKYGEEYFIALDGYKTLNEAFLILQDSKFQVNQTYLVASLPENQYLATSFLELKSVVAKMGINCFSRALRELPIPVATMVIPVDTPKSGKEIIDWVALHPESIVIVVAENRPIGLFANPNRSIASDIFGTINLIRLHGDYIELLRDPRANYIPRIKPPTCPHCLHVGFYDYDAMQKYYFCTNCKQDVQGL
jgi:hypothetical protein